MTATMVPAAPAHDDLRKDARAKLEKARDIAAKCETEARDFTDAERVEVKSLLEDARDLTAKADTLGGDADLRKSITEGLGRVDRIDTADPLAIGTTGMAAKARKTMGELFVENDRFKAWLAGLSTSSGRIPDSAKGIQSPAVDLGAEGLKAIVAGSVDTSAGSLLTNDWLGLQDGLGQFQRELTLVDLITKGSTDGDTVEYARVTGFTNNADTVPEATGTSAGTASGDVAGTKPESALALEKITETVKTIAHWIPATKRALSDAGQIRTLIDAFLRYGLNEELEDQIATGGGTGEDFEGILTVDGTQDQAWSTDLLTTARKAKTKVRTIGRAKPTAYLLNPVDNERIDLTKDDNGGYYFGGPAGVGVQTLWGLPRVECEAIPAGTGIVGDFRQAVLWDREATTVAVSDSHSNFFVRNLVAILAEMRAAFGVIRPSAFVVIDLTA